jgi:acyl-CoA thioesterase-1
VQEHKLLILGDSLSAAYGLTQQQGWVYLLQNAWVSENKPITVINGAISGDTTDGGLSRLPRLLDLHKPTHLLIELGGNDALQGHNPKKIKANIEQMVQLAQKNNVEVMLQEMQIPTNYGKRYTQMFMQVFTDIAAENNIPLIPFFLENIALNKDLMQNDGIHPTAEAQPMITELLKPQLEVYIFD